jgi:predicted DNA binding CopG/RHH family protein
MAKTVEIPDELHEALEARAAKEGLPLQTYVARALRTVAEDDQARAELLERIRNRSAVDLGVAAADLIREGREERTRTLTERWSSSTLRR